MTVQVPGVLKLGSIVMVLSVALVVTPAANAVGIVNV